MSLYIKALRRISTDIEFNRFLLYSGLFYKYLKAAKMLEEYITWYEDKLIDLCLERIFILDDVITILAEILAQYLIYIGEPKEKVQNIVKAFVDFASLTRAKAEYTYELLISKTRGERAQLAAIQKVLFHIGETIDILRKFFEEPLDSLINYIMIRRRHTQALVEKVSLLSKKLKKLEGEEGIEIEIQSHEEVQSPKESETKEKEIPEIPKEVINEIESELKEIATKQETGLFNEKELKLLMALVELGLIDKPSTVAKEKLEAKLGMSWSAIKKLARHINLKLIEKFKVPIIVIDLKEDSMYLNSNLVNRIKEQLRNVAPTFVAAFEEKVSSSQPLK